MGILALVGKSLVTSRIRHAKENSSCMQRDRFLPSQVPSSCFPWWWDVILLQTWWMEFPFSGNSSQAYGSIYVTTYIPAVEVSLLSLPLSMLDCSQGQPEGKPWSAAAGHLWEANHSSLGLKSWEATIDPWLHLCGTPSEVPSLQLIPTGTGSLM